MTARFVLHGRSADDAILDRLQKLGRQARNYTLVSSDRVVATAGRAAHCQVLSSEDFARIIMSALEKDKQGANSGVEREMDPDEVDEWLRLFGEDS